MGGKQGCHGGRLFQKSGGTKLLPLRWWRGIMPKQAKHSAPSKPAPVIAGAEQSLSLLRATLESTADGILVVDNAGKFISYNQNFAVMWGIPESVLKAG